MRNALLLYFLFSATTYCSLIFNEGFEEKNWSSQWSTSNITTSSTYKSEGKFSAALTKVNSFLLSPAIATCGMLSMDIRATNIERRLNICFGKMVDGSFIEKERVSYQATSANIFIAFSYELKNRDLTHFHISKEQGAGSFQFDNIKVYDFKPTFILESNAHNRLTTNNKYILYSVKASTNLSYALLIEKLSFDILGNCSKELLQNINFQLMSSDTNKINLRTRLLSTAKIESNKLIFNDPFFVNHDDYILLWADLNNCNALGDDNGALLNIILSESEEYENGGEIEKVFSINPPFVLMDDFISLYKNPWQNPTGDFLIIDSANTFGAGRVYTNNQKLLCNKSSGNNIIYLASPVIYGRWSFFVADGQYWKVTARNNIRIILSADTFDFEKLRELNFNGYYLIYDKTFKLYRANGESKTLLADTFTPTRGDTESTNNGYDISISHILSGHWYMSINGKIVIPNASYENVIDNEISKSVSFGFNTYITTEIENEGLTGKRVAYLDNLYIEEFVNNVTKKTEKAINFKINLEDGKEIISWEKVPGASFQLCYFDNNENNWLNYCITTENKMEVKNITAENWRLIAKSDELGTKTFSLNTGEQQNIILTEGWNLIGDSGDDDFRTMIQEKFENKIWQWNGRYYEQNNTIRPLTAFWIKSSKRQKISFSSSINYQNTPNNLDNRGWQLISFNEKNSFFAEGVILQSYNGDDYETHNHYDINNYLGYWIFNE